MKQARHTEPDYPARNGAEVMGWQRNLRRAVSRWLTGQGFHVEPNRMLSARFAELSETPDTVIDVGVGRGTPWLYGAFPDRPFLLVDPMSEAREMVAKNHPGLKAEFVETALGETAGTADLNIPIWRGAAHMPMASLLNRSDKHVSKISGWEQRSVAVTTLDDLTAQRSGSFGLKIDAEGAEAAILRGAAQTLKRCLFVVLELSLSRRFAEVEPPSRPISLLAAAGLEFRDILEINGGSEYASPRHIDALFTRWAAPPTD